jgi:hypothetical protein
MNYFPLPEVRTALKMKLFDAVQGHRGPIVAVMYSRKYMKPMLTFCTASQSKT